MRSSRRQRPDDPSPPPPPSTEERVRAAVARFGTDPDGFDTACDGLAMRPDDTMAVAGVMLAELLADLWDRGWTPEDLLHVLGRKLRSASVALASEWIVTDGDGRIADGQALHPAWRAQIERLRSDRRRSPAPVDIDRSRGLLEVLGVASRLPDIPVTVPPPGDLRSGLGRGVRLDERMLQRVRALLAKAESTDFDEEAEALTAKAQQLIARHAIDEALLDRGDDVGEPSIRRMPVDDPYASAKAYLLAEVARANRCRVVHTPDLGWVTAFGYEHDLAAVELLSTSLLAQAAAAMARQGVRRDAAGRSRTRSFRRAFLLGFGHRIGERLRLAAEQEVAVARAGNDRLVPVLAAREDRLVAAQQRAFPAVRRRATSVSHPSGWSEGRAAAEQARLDVVAPRLPRA
ncbi:MAG: DUF2786 domain-containing protein [Intrasporangiaceae bacterium]|nr:DUF2786 domain-containing protein [Intrasporangiaceae bacterium]